MSAETTDAPAGNNAAVVTIKKYANRRLYNTASSSYVTLDALSRMVKNGENFVVYDAKSGEDITRSVLTQIIFEEEAKGENLLPINFLRQLIQFYGAPMQGVLPSYLEMSLETFARNQEHMHAQISQASTPFDAMQVMARSNMAWVESAMGMFAPFAAPPAGAGQPSAGAAKPANGADTTDSAAASDAAAAQSAAQQPQTKPQQPQPEPKQSQAAARAAAATHEIDLLRDQMATMQAALEGLTASRRASGAKGSADDTDK